MDALAEFFIEVIKIVPQHVLCIVFLIVLHLTHKGAVKEIRKSCDKLMQELRCAYDGLNSQKPNRKN